MKLWRTAVFSKFSLCGWYNDCRIKLFPNENMLLIWPIGNCKLGFDITLGQPYLITNGFLSREVRPLMTTLKSLIPWGPVGGAPCWTRKSRGDALSIFQTVFWTLIIDSCTTHVCVCSYIRKKFYVKNISQVERCLGDRDSWIISRLGELWGRLGLYYPRKFDGEI